MLEFLRRNLLVVSGLFMVLALALVLRANGEPLRSDPLGRWFLEILSLPQRPVAALDRSIARARRSIVEAMSARRDVDGLRARVHELEEEAARLRDVEHENERLRALLDFRQTLRGDLVGARVIGRDAGTLARTLVIDRGERDGVVKGAPVVVPGGVVGRVFLVSPHAARVLLITDHNSGVDAVVERTRARGIVEGQVDGGCVLKFVTRTEDVQVGDVVVTSGGDGLFPRGLPIGRVTTIDKRGQGLFQHAVVAPSVDMGDLDEVLVTRGPPDSAPPMSSPGG
jgi:rod shape-determining protein MreC